MCSIATKAQICTSIDPLYQPNKFPFLFPESNGEKTKVVYLAKKVVLSNLVIHDFVHIFCPFVPSHTLHP